ncbi:L-aspartate oxidase [Peribacillus muralis]|uniref:L-aspartate oxidase n=1 Tax=Peribacillus muralis TaxID=264697 RepID=UPI001F4DC482|nr:L-aspartate oxidase [Peribacillus muralis]MCK1991690.1 L-aspartate oxidase [Peribacillus muralis]MCK2012248.1 L-aspartate oxidase [Peribacillus muralis]
MMVKAEVIVIGSGIAALKTAMEASEHKHVILITKSTLRHSNSYLAQGGIAAALSNQDGVSLHKKDTLAAGQRYNKVKAVEKLVCEAPAAIAELLQSGMQFDRNHDGTLMLGMEGAHSERRILHSHGDGTGKYIMEHLIGCLRRSLITVIENEAAVELIIGKDGSCIGVKTIKKSGEMAVYHAERTVLATGGCGSLYRLTSNSQTVSGDGIALAFKAGAKVRDMEFIQFHPTLLFMNNKTGGLVSEAVRGDGAILVTEKGRPIMEGVHDLKDLAPRHIVAQTIFSYVQRGEKVFLDISMIKDFKKRFPTVSSLCETSGVNLQAGRIPVAPGNHFLMGGIEVDEWGQTSVPSLYAVGEVACTGVHGANRLASNSLLEGLVFGKALGDLLAHLPAREMPEEKQQSKGFCPIATLPELPELQERLMNETGIVRTEAGLMRLKNYLEAFHIERLLDMDVTGQSITEITKANAIIVAWLIAESALTRTESRGGHFRSDYPSEDDSLWLGNSVILASTDVKNRLKGRRLYEYIEA